MNNLSSSEWFESVINEYKEIEKDSNEPVSIKQGLYDLMNDCYRSENSAIDYYKIGLNTDKGWDMAFEYAVRTYNKWIKVKEYINKNNEINIIGLNWNIKNEISTRNINNWKRAIYEYDYNAILPDKIPTIEDLNNYPYCEIVEEFEGIKIFNTMYKYPFIRKSELYYMVANQLEIYGKTENINQLKEVITPEVGELYIDDNREYNGEINGLLTLNNFKIVEFPSQDIKELLEKYNIKYGYNYMMSLD